MTEFEKYSSIENSHNTKFISKVKDQIHPDTLFVVTEKIHGANFSVTYNKAQDKVSFGKRSGFIKEGENFYGHLKIVDELEEAIRMVAYENPNASVITVFGEICGGTLNGIQAEGAVKVQKEVEYSEDVEFIAFDLMIDGEYASHDSFFTKLAGYFDFAPLIVSHIPLSMALEIDTDFDSKLPDKFGYDKKQDNQCEGVVIKPVRNITLGNGKRLILKKKNPRFLENKGSKSKVKKEVNLPDEVKDTLSDFTAYLTQQRLDNVISKIGKVTTKDFGKVCGLLVQDALTDFDKEVMPDGVSLKQQLDDHWKTFQKEGSKVAGNLIRLNWTNYLED